MYMVAVVTDMEVITPTEIILQAQVTSVAHNLHHITKETTLIDISHMLHGELVVMVLDKTTEVLEVEKVLS